MACGTSGRSAFWTQASSTSGAVWHARIEFAASHCLRRLCRLARLWRRRATQRPNFRRSSLPACATSFDEAVACAVRDCFCGCWRTRICYTRNRDGRYGRTCDASEALGCESVEYKSREERQISIYFKLLNFIRRAVTRELDKAYNRLLRAFLKRERQHTGDTKRRGHEIGPHAAHGYSPAEQLHTSADRTFVAVAVLAAAMVA